MIPHTLCAIETSFLNHTTEFNIGSNHIQG